jgi:hypothetical protein
VGGRFAAGEVEHPDVHASSDHFHDGTSHAEFGVVGMGGNDEGVEHCCCQGN